MNDIVPNIITAGVSFRACTTQPAFGEGWALFLYLRGPASIDIEATRSASTYEFTADPATTAEWAPGAYAYTIRATDGVEVVEVQSGRVKIAADIAAAGEGFDDRSHARKTLEAIEAVIEKRASMDQERYRINNRELYRTPIAELLRLRNTYRAEVQREDAKASGRRGWRQVRVVMGPTGRRR